MEQMRDQHDQPLITNLARGHLLHRGDTVPADASVGYAPGCIFIHTDGSGNGAVLYVNNGTKASSLFKPLYSFTQGAALTAQLTTITPADAEGTPDYAIASIINTSAYGFASAQEAITVLYVIKNLQTRLAEVEARLEAAGIVAAN